MVGFWIALAVFLLCVVVGLAVVAVRGLEAWRQLKATKACVGGEITRIVGVTEQIEGQLAAAAASHDRLQASLKRLGASRERLQVQLAAVTEARWMLRRALPFLSR